INNSGKLSKMDRALVLTVIEGGGGGGGIVSLISITYAELAAAIAGSTLIPGQSYLLSDFATIYDQPDYDAAGVPKVTVATLEGNPEPLVLFATSVNTISSTVISIAYPKDQLQYNVNFNSTEWMGAPAKGRITLRIDDMGNRTDYDHRVVLFLRYETTESNFDSVNDNGNASFARVTFLGSGADREIGNFLDDFAIYFNEYSLPFLLPNNLFLGNCNTNTFGPLCMNNTFNSACTGNKLLGGTQYLILGSTCLNNTFGTGSFGTLSNNNSKNIFGRDCDITMGSSNVDHSFGDDCTISIGTNNNKQTFGSSCSITCGDSNTKNKFGIANNPLILGNLNSQNSFGESNTINLGNSNSDNKFGNSNAIVMVDFNIANSAGSRNTLTYGTSINNNKVLNGNTLIFQDMCSKNNIDNGCTLTLFLGSSFNNIKSNNLDAGTFTAALVYNNIGAFTLQSADFSAASHVYMPYTCETFLKDTTTPRLSYFSAVDVLTVVAPNA
ncbi:MAG: hypothetical protein V4549_12595, partial [Bacteroidota bacterium]